MKRVPPDDAKPSNKALKANVPVVRSAKLPAVHKQQYRDFDDFARQGEFLLNTFDRWQEIFFAVKKVIDDDDDERSADAMILQRALDRAEVAAAETRRPHINQQLKTFIADWTLFNYDELYEDAREATDLLDRHRTSVLTRSFVSVQLGLAVAMINNKAQNPKLYSRMMVDEVIAARPDACALEATCREIRRTKTYLPSGPELLEILRRQMEHWAELAEIEDDLAEGWQSGFDHQIVSLKSKLAEQQQREQRQIAERAERNERLRIERERIEREAKERAERIAAEQEARERRSQYIRAVIKARWPVKNFTAPALTTSSPTFVAVALRLMNPGSAPPAA